MNQVISNTNIALALVLATILGCWAIQKDSCVEANIFKVNVKVGICK